MMQTDKYKDVFYLYIIFVLLIALLTSCNPVKQVLKDNDKMIEVWEKGVLKDWCEVDSFYVNTKDTLINFDTLYALDLQVDTLLINEVQTIVKKEIKTVVKTVQITDTLKYVDKSKINVLKKEHEKELSKKDKELEKVKANFEDTKNDLELTKKQRNKWTFRFFALLTIIVVVAFRKPILTFFSGGWSKIISLLK